MKMSPARRHFLVSFPEFFSPCEGQPPPPAFENWASFARDFLLHENPYTGRRYVDEPGMPLLCL